jgi:hypothetical protein
MNFPFFSIGIHVNLTLLSNPLAMYYLEGVAFRCWMTLGLGRLVVCEPSG